MLSLSRPSGGDRQSGGQQPHRARSASQRQWHSDGDGCLCGRPHTEARIELTSRDRLVAYGKDPLFRTLARASRGVVRKNSSVELFTDKVRGRL